jgi:hypothetical protein
MSPVEASLRRLQNSFSDFVAPATPFRDVDAIKAQIELRRRALRDIELIRIRLGTFIGRKKKAPNRRLRRVARPFRVRVVHVPERVSWQVCDHQYSRGAPVRPAK